MTRGGSLALANLRGACSPCNAAKGSLLPGEYKTLLKGLESFTEAGRNDVMKRLRGGILHFGNQRKADLSESLKASPILAIPAAKKEEIF